MPKVYNRHHKDAPTSAVYIGRGTAWGNPFSHIPIDETTWTPSREKAVEMFRQHCEEDPQYMDKIKRYLNGKDLICSCAPLACHGDVLLEIANGD